MWMGYLELSRLSDRLITVVAISLFKLIEYKIMETENGTPVADSTQLQSCQQELDRCKESYLRLQADIENIKRRMYKEQEQQVKRTMADLFTDLLPVADNFDRALHASKETHANDTLLQGLMLIRKEFAQVLERHGVREMTEVKVFDPELHEALSHIEAENTESGSVISVLEKGYWYKDQVLRYAKVVVAR